MTMPEKRSKKLLVRWTPTDYARIVALARTAEITPTDYIRVRALDGSTGQASNRAPSVERQLLATALSQLGNVGAVLREIEAQARAGERPFDHVLHPALREVRLASRAILKALGVAL